MKKVFSLIAFTCLAMTGWAQLPAGVENVALNKAKVLSYSSFREGEKSRDDAGIFDGNLGSKWCSEGQSISPNPWIVIDLKQNVSISMIAMRFEQTFASAYSIYASNNEEVAKKVDQSDNTGWGTPIYSVTGLTRDGNPWWQGLIELSPATPSYRYLKLYCNELDSEFGKTYGWGIMEMQIAGEVSPVDEIEVSNEPDSHGYYIVTGYISANTVKQINELTYPALDLTNATIDPAVTTVSTANVNTIFAITDAQAAQLTGNTKNTINRNGWNVARTPIEFVDNGSPIWSPVGGNQWLDSNTQGLTYTRTIAAGQYATTMLPAVPTSLDGLTFYEMEELNGSTLSFKVVASPVPNIPYIVYSEAGATITCSATGDTMTKTAETAAKVDITGISFQGNYIEKAGAIDGGYALSAGATSLVLKKIGENTKIGPFRAYFVLESAPAKTITLSFDDETTGISNVEASANDCIFNIAGQRVNANAKGIVIKNGKKFIVK